MLIHIVIIFCFILIATFFNIISLRYLIKRKLKKLDYKSDKKYIISENKIYIIINIFSMNAWIVENIKNDKEWIKFKKKLPLFYICKSFKTNFKHLTLFNSPETTHIFSRKIDKYNIVHCANILSLRYNFKKKQIKFLTYFSGEVIFNRLSKLDKNDHFIKLFQDRNNDSTISEKELYKYDSKRECIEILYDLKKGEFYINNYNDLDDNNYKIIINDSVDNGIPLYSYWKTFVVILVFILSYIIKIT
ncbi:hypothetical protein CPAV1605_272 [seawater metagenome]|uniref:Uncharacterized protein n=1 Tax=seawater metagenome TaxID=1561972 RepID=A0A5E8CHL9_9ZZZZ